MLDLKKLREGDIAVNIGSGQAYRVVYVNDGVILVMRTIRLTNPTEWVRHEPMTLPELPE